MPLKLKIETPASSVTVTENLTTVLSTVMKCYNQENIFILVDENTRRFCLPEISETAGINRAKIIEIKSGEENKSIDTCGIIWNFLSSNGADRESLLINLGGGVICDMGGFAAATFKRGIDFINIPTSLLAQVDASVGGKLGINFLNLKNEIGLFQEPRYVLVYPAFIRTLDRENILSGFAEMIKHALISNEEHYNSLKQVDIHNPDPDLLMMLIFESIRIKNNFVSCDFKDMNKRKALNFGHTLGHAVESLSMIRGRPVRHGIAIARGMIGELYLSHKCNGFDKTISDNICQFIFNIFQGHDFNKDDQSSLAELITHDKKNKSAMLNFTLLADIGKVTTDNYPAEKDIFEAIEFMNTF
jgi:3-dehydroquinate synthase